MIFQWVSKRKEMSLDRSTHLQNDRTELFLFIRIFSYFNFLVSNIDS